LRLSLQSRRRWFLARGAALFVAILLLPAPGAADARSDYLIRLLKGSTQFRVRAQAAISLGGVGAAPDVVDALASSLQDEHPAVRASAATSLSRLADPRALRALRAAAQDPEPPVRTAVRAAIVKLEGEERQNSTVAAPPPPPRPSGPTRYYVAVGRPASRVPGFSAAELDRVQQILRERVAALEGVQLAAAQESPASVRALLRSRSLRGFYIDSAITTIERKPGGSTRVAVSVIVATYPDRAMRAIMQGAATASGGGDTRAQAIGGALKSALSQLPQAMARE
jgi:hypothetical protein